MKDKKFLSFVMVACALLSGGCTEEEINGFGGNEQGATTLSAYIENGGLPGTRTVIGEGNRVDWVATDRISVFGSGETQNAPFSFASVQADGTARFTGELAASGEKPCVAYYPYGESVTLEGNTLKMQLPIESDYDGNCNGPMLGLPQADGTFRFRHLAALLKVTILDMPADTRKLRIRSLDGSISGKFIVDDITAADAVMEDNNLFRERARILRLPQAMTAGRQTFYVPVPPTTYGELIVELLNESDDVLWYKKSKNVAFKRGVILEMPETGTAPVVRITSHTDGETLKGYGAINHVTLKGYIDNYYKFNGFVTLVTEEGKKDIYDGYWNPPHLPTGYLDGKRHSFEMTVDMHRGRNVYTVSMLGTDTGGNKSEATYDFVLNYEENDTPAEAVDLGLTVKWASHNLGASKPSEPGWRYIWADNTGTDVWSEEERKKLKENIYHWFDTGMDDKGICGNETYDAAAYKWRGKWRMPNSFEVKELLELATWTPTDMDGVRGYKVTGPNGNSIFLPLGDLSDFSGGFAVYWIGCPHADISQVYDDRFQGFIKKSLSSDSDGVSLERCLGMSPHRLYIRPVCGDMVGIEQ